jgi:glutathione S-transferase
MPVLRHSPTSPFVRKVTIAARLLGLSDRITVRAADPGDPTDSLRSENPLGKIPALVLDDGTTVYDSPVILEWLDLEAGGGRILPSEPKARIAARTLEALADGLLDAAVLCLYETRLRAEGERSATWLDRQHGKIERALAHLEANPPALEPITVGSIALACALGFLDLRFDGLWRKDHPALVGWLDGFAARVPAFAETRPA